MRGFQPAVVLTLAAFIAGACAPAGGFRGASPEAAPVRKTLTLASQQEPVAVLPRILGNVQGEVGAETKHLLHDTLVGEHEYDRYTPQLAVELPSIEAGSWRLNSDGTMDTIWRLRPNARWHDGRPLTSADLTFTFQVNHDPDLPTTEAAMARLMESAFTPDEQTMVIHWRGPYVTAFRQEPGEILPRHLLEEIYLADKTSFLSSRLLTTEFVGLGPYRLVRWDQGSHIEAARFDDYYQGRPAFDSVVVRFIPDPNTMLANILAGSVDAILSYSSQGLDIDVAMEIKRRWEGTGNQVLTSETGKVYTAEPQYRPEYARPRNGVVDLRVRQALSHAIDRQTLVEVITHGLAPAADSYFAPADPLRPQLEDAIPQYPFDPGRASQLLAEAGWTRGSDGVLVQSANGERFELDFWARQGPGNEKIASTVADGWKSLGAAMTIFIIPTAQVGSREFESQRPGFLLVNASGAAYFEREKLHSRQIPSPATRWAGNNFGGYSNPRVDALVDRLNATIDPRERAPIHRELVRESMADVATIPLFWQVTPVLMREGIRGPRPRHVRPTSNIFEWDRT